MIRHLGNIEPLGYNFQPMNIVLFSAEEIGSPLPASDRRYQHVQNILHKKVGDSFEAGIINGDAGKACITELTAEYLTFDFIPATDGMPLYPVTMIIGFPRPIQLKRLLRDVASLGVQAVHLVGTDLGEKSYLQSNMSNPQAVWDMLRDGSVQAKSTHVPSATIHRSLEDCLAALQLSSTCTVALDNGEPSIALTEYLSQKQSQGSSLQHTGVIAAIGSERGWTARERQLFLDNEFTLCSMGQRVLRTETASTVAISLILSCMGII